MQTDLADQVVLVTGASGGIGSAAAALLAEEQARVVLHYHRNKQTAEELRNQLGDRAAATLQADLRDERQVEQLFKQAIDICGRINHIVVNAGIWPAEDVLLSQMSLERWNETINSDLTSAFLTCRAFLQHLEQVPRDDASIVLVGSTAALFGEAGHADYAAAKAAMTHGLTLSLKNEIVATAPRGRVNCICPGWTRTPMTRQQLGNIDSAAMQQMFPTQPLKKAAEPRDIAAMIAFLLSDTLASHISGAIIPVAGGMEGRLIKQTES